MNLSLQIPAILAGLFTAIVFGLLWQWAHPWIYPFFFGAPVAVVESNYEQVLLHKLPALFSYTVFSSLFTYIPTGYVSASFANTDPIRHGVIVGILIAAFTLVYAFSKGVPMTNTIYLLLALHMALAFGLCAFGARVRQIQLGQGGHRKYSGPTT